MTRPDHPVVDDLNRSVKQGVMWVGLERILIQILNLTSSIILARLLVPSDFGLVGMATFFTGLSSRFMQLGFGAAAIRQKTLRPDHLSSLFTMTLVTNGAVMATLVLMAPLAGTYFRTPLVTDILRVLSLNFLIRCIGTCPHVLLRRQMNFRATTVASMADYGVKLAVTISLALSGYGVWSLVYGELAGSVADKLYMAWAVRWRPGLRVTRAAFDDLWMFGFTMSFNGTVTYFSENVDNLIVGRVLGAAPLGFYEKSYNLMRLPVAELSARMSTVLFPAFSRLQDDPGRLRAALRKTLLVLSLVGYPLFATLSILAPTVIGLMYGPRWTGAIVPFQILCLAGPARMVLNVVASAMNAAGFVSAELKRRVVVFVLLATGAYVGSSWGLAGVAWAVALATLVSQVLIVTVAARVLPVRVSDLLAPQASAAMGTAGLVAVELVTYWGLQSWGWPGLAAGALAALLGSATYFLILVVLPDERLKTVVAEFRSDLLQMRKHRLGKTLTAPERPS